jgi:hypothetical protein
MNAPSSQSESLKFEGDNRGKGKVYLRCSSCRSHFAVDPIDVIGPSMINGIPPHIDPIFIEKESISFHSIWWVSLWWNGYIAFLLVLSCLVVLFIL